MKAIVTYSDGSDDPRYGSVANAIARRDAAGGQKRSCGRRQPDAPDWAKAIVRRSAHRARSGRALCRHCGRPTRARARTKAVVAARAARRSDLGERESVAKREARQTGRRKAGVGLAQSERQSERRRTRVAKSRRGRPATRQPRRAHSRRMRSAEVTRARRDQEDEPGAGPAWSAACPMGMRPACGPWPPEHERKRPRSAAPD
jgi:hypothetical protein